MFAQFKFGALYGAPYTIIFAIDVVVVIQPCRRKGMAEDHEVPKAGKLSKAQTKCRI